MAKPNQPLVSVVVPVYNVEDFVPKCLNSILAQTYRDIEVIVVNDGSDGDVNSIVAEHQKHHNNVKLIDLKTNKGLFRARLEGFKAATGDYVMSVDGDDSISIDYVRTMVNIARSSGSDIVLPETVIENDNVKFIYNLANELPFDYLEGERCLEEFFRQKGENFMWHRVAAPLYSKKILALAMPFLDTIDEHIVMCEDLLFSVVFWSFAQRIDRSSTAYYFYYQHDKSSVVHSEGKALEKRMRDINVVVSFVEYFLKSQNIYSKFERELGEWMNLYSLEYHSHIDKQDIGGNQKEKLVRTIKFGDKEWKKKGPSRFYGVTTIFNEKLEELKKKITDDQISIISFDIFDTLVTRPFLVPSDLFYLMDKDFHKLENRFRLQGFRDIRIKAEEIARNNKDVGEDVTLSQIYNVLQERFLVAENVANIMLEKEIDYEIRYCTTRKTAKELYDLAHYIGKRIIITSDMYLPVSTLETILKNCGYSSHSDLYVSSQRGEMKATSNLYKQIAGELRVAPHSMLHIGDNYDSDVVSAERARWSAVYFPKTTEQAAGLFSRIFGEDTIYASNHLGITTSYAIASNKYFDNPYRSYHLESDYNCSPYLMGFFALGLSTFGFTKWMVDDLRDKKINSAVFLGRDGYLPLQIFNIFKHKLNLSIESHYLPSSRKATIPLSLFSEANIPDIESFNYRGHMTESILASLRPYFKTKTANDIKNLDLNKISKLQKAFINTYGKYFRNPTAVVDIGYSGRPEQVFSELFNVAIETYFMFTAKDEAKRRLGEAVNIYGRLNAAPIREKLVSELAPSCVGYRVAGDRVEPVFEGSLDMSYYEIFIISQAQKGASNFATDYLKFFGDHLEDIYFGDNSIALQPLNQITASPTRLDREMFRGFLHEDDVAVDGSMNIYDEYYKKLDDTVIAQDHAEAMRLNLELASHMSIKRSAILLAGNIKRRILYGKNR